MARLAKMRLDEPLGFIEEYVTKGMFTDGGSTAGTYQMKQAIPVGAYVLNTVVTQVTAFSGDTSAVITVGDGSDVDRYNTGTPSVFSTVAALAMGVPSGTKEHTAAIYPTLTVTSASDFTATASTGALAIRIVYLKGL